MRRIVTSLVFLAVLASGSVFTPTASAATVVAGDEARVLELLNGTRAEKGLAKLPSHPALVQMARGQSERMAERGTICHNTNLGGEATSLGLVWLRIGENVGMGPHVDVIEEALLDSPPHYANIVEPSHNAAGVGVVHTGDGVVFVTQVFANLKAAAPPPPPPPPTAPPAPRVAPQVAAAPPPAPPAVAPTPTMAPTPAPPRWLPTAVIGGKVAAPAPPAR